MSRLTKVGIALTVLALAMSAVNTKSWGEPRWQVVNAWESAILMIGVLLLAAAGIRRLYRRARAVEKYRPADPS